MNIINRDVKADDQILRLYGLLMIVIAVHYFYEKNNINGMKAASIGRTVFGILVVLLTYFRYFDKIFYLFALQDGLAGIYGVIQSVRLQQSIKQLL